MIVFDIETGPRPMDEIRDLMPPFDGELGPFDPSAVKCGNLRDAAKIEAKIADAAAAHRAALESMDQRRAEHEKTWYDRCALSPLTGHVLAVGWMEGADTRDCFCVGDEFTSETGQPVVIIDENWLIEYVWRTLADVKSAPFVGHNIFGFDLPFLIRRSWLLGIDVPDHIRNGRYWSPIFVDLMDVWGCGSREMVALDTLAKACGLAGKPDGINGGMFAELLRTNRPQAIAYLKNDLAMTWGVASQLQVV